MESVYYDTARLRSIYYDIIPRLGSVYYDTNRLRSIYYYRVRLGSVYYDTADWKYIL